MTAGVSIELASDLADVGDLLADAQAYEAAGADTLWLRPAFGLDLWPILGALAALTHRVRIGMTCDLPGSGPIDGSCRTVSRLSRGRLVLALDGPADEVEAFQRGWRGEGRPRLLAVAHDQASAVRAAGAMDGFVHRGDLETAGPLIASARAARSDGATLECWMRVGMPSDGPDWDEVRAGYAALGATGVILPQSPRSLGLLRNPGAVDDRSDLQVAQG